MKKVFQEKDLQLLIGNLLRFGVLFSMTVVVIGLGLFLYENHGTVTDFSVFNPVHFDFSSLFLDLKSFDSKAIMAFGVSCLIATPVLRVIFSIIGFSKEKDYLYVVISSIVLIIIAFSMYLGAVS